MSRFQTIVVAVDFSDAAPDVLRAAVALASPDPQARVHLVHVVPDPVPAIWSDELPQIDVHLMEHTWRDGATRQLAAFAAEAQLDPGRFEQVVAVGTAAPQIVRYAEEHHADVIVMGSHGHGLVHRFLLGSVAERVLRQAPCAVLIVPYRTVRATSQSATEAAGEPAAEAGAAPR
jgi:nucleotide-binding universal stress UspA family protein